MKLRSIHLMMAPSDKELELSQVPSNAANPFRFHHRCILSLSAVAKHTRNRVIRRSSFPRKSSWPAIHSFPAATAMESGEILFDG